MAANLDSCAWPQNGPDATELPAPAHCPICRCQRCRPLGIIYGYPIWNCLGCDVGFVWPQPDDALLRKYYGPSYWANYQQDERPIYERPDLCNQVFRRQLQFLDRLLAGNRQARILDVGAGDGTMLRLLGDAGYTNGLGLDIDPDNCARARARLGVTVECRDFLLYQEKDWHAITLWAVIEHLKDPVSFVQHARRLLKPGGMLVLMTGDNNSLCAKLQGCFDMWMYPPEHLFFFGRRSLRELFHRGELGGFRCRIGYQSWWKEAALTMLRVLDSGKRMLRRSTRPSWRSTASNLLTSWGFRPNDHSITREITPLR
jgi:SAM-dependent methyltransferase